MIPLSHLQLRRRQFLERLPGPALLFAGGIRPRNNPFNEYPFRADSNFLLFFARPEPDSAAFFDPADGSVTLFLPERTLATAVWEGSVPGFAEAQEAHGVDAVLGIARLAEHVEQLAHGRPVLTVALADDRTTDLARRITGLPLDQTDPGRIAPPELVDVLAALRNRKAEPEIEEIRAAGAVTREAFLRAMGESRPGVTEQELAGTVGGWYARNGCSTGYSTILSIRGEVLHNRTQEHTLRAGDLVLMDSGAERRSGYGADVTRAWPASGELTPEQRDVYRVVLDAHLAAEEAVGPGARWLEVHLASARVIARGLTDLKLLKGDPDDLVQRGAHTVFYPHGVGHFLGLDTHDLRVFGDRVLYPAGRKRSTEFGTNMLRMDPDLEPGQVVTVEPGIYFIPGLIHGDEFRSRFPDAVDWDRAAAYLEMNDGRGFGGIRIEDDFLVTEDGRENLTPDIPKEPGDVEAAVRSAAWA